MPSKLQEYSELAAHTEGRLTDGYEKWLSFLETSARLYKYPYRDQVMIFAQRPDAIACADYALWNNRMGRYVRRGSKGIALIDESGGEPRLRYVFDVSDTGARPHARAVQLWSYREEHRDTVSKMLVDTYGVSNANLTIQLEQVAAMLAADYWNNHKRDVLDIVDGSFLEGYDEYNVGSAFRSAAAISITYSLMFRCGLEPRDYLLHEDFLNVFDFNTNDSVGVLGSAVSVASQQVLRQIEAVVKRYEHEKIVNRQQEQASRKPERTVEHGGTDVFVERGLSNPEHQAERGTGDAPAAGQIRNDAETVSGGTPARPVESSEPEREIVPAPAGDRRGGAAVPGRTDASAGKRSRSDGRAESPRPDALGGTDEQLQGPGGGDYTDGAGVQLNPEPEEITAEESGQLNLFPSEAEQIQAIDEAEGFLEPFASTFSQEEIAAAGTGKFPEKHLPRWIWGSGRRQKDFLLV